MLIKLIILFVCSLAVTYFFMPFSILFAQNKGLVTIPSQEKIDQRKISYLGGAVICCVFLTFSVLARFFDLFYLGFSSTKFFIFIFCAAIIAGFGLYDDLKECGPFVKLAQQIFGALILSLFVLQTEISWLNNSFNVLLSVLCIVILINAFNLLDIVDGLAGGISLINMISFFILGILTGNYFVVLLTVILSAVLLAFLYYNLPPAKIIMGDTGSQFLGFIQVVIALSLCFSHSARQVSIIVPLLVLSLPLFDLLFVVLMRMQQKKSIFLKSNDHFVLRMLKTGICTGDILKLMFTISICTNFSALLAYYFSNISGIIIFFVPILAFLLFSVKLSKLEVD
ncbi:MAG: hypothetical protein DRP78_02805 [Candidatus Omnitrophota bacterium]|nr:MAG: hypothetical protein DRP78_02805 [Candidatus Omnitrophota bacterium]